MNGTLCAIACAVWLCICVGQWAIEYSQCKATPLEFQKFAQCSFIWNPAWVGVQMLSTSLCCGLCLWALASQPQASRYAG